MTSSSTLSKTTLSKTTIAQISDCHLFADINGLHHGVNVYKNLQQVLRHISQNTTIENIVFTGDLTQDHTEASYQNFVTAIKNEKINIPVYYLAGNHDEVSLLNKYLVGEPFRKDKAINTKHWQIQLLHSKSNTPSGIVEDENINTVINAIEPDKHQFIMMHHHPIDVGYFIDKHGLINKEAFWSKVKTISKLAAIACGHVHRASKIAKNETNIEGSEIEGCSSKNIGRPTVEQCVDVYTCPATSIQFDPQADTVEALDKGPGYRLFYLGTNGTLSSEPIWC
jgi:Icc protein